MSNWRRPPAAARIVVAFALVYLIWGSTYLAIHIAIETMPPFTMAAVRFLLAGSVLYVWLRLRGAARPNGAQWRSTAIVGVLLLVLGNGLIVWGEEVLPSSIAALLVAMVPVWMALIDWVRPGGTRPRLGVLLGLGLGFVGVGLLVFQRGGEHSVIVPMGVVVVLFASLCWAAGSIYARTARMPAAPLLGTAMEMLCGGAVLVVFALAHGEATQIHLATVSRGSALALAYLVVFGSLVAFSMYVWLLRTVSPARVSTYAYVNPAVAIFLGWKLDNEPISAQTLVAAAVILGGVALVMVANGRAAHARLASPTQLSAQGANSRSA